MSYCSNRLAVFLLPRELAPTRLEPTRLYQINAHLHCVNEKHTEFVTEKSL
jgi:hypothetical protein